MKVNKYLPSFAIIYILTTLLVFCSGNQPGGIPVTDTILHDSNSFFYLDTNAYPADRKTLPVGVFDSGTGGLTVLDAILKFDRYDNENGSFAENGDGKGDFDAEQFIYLGDQANMPYGSYSQENNVPLLKEHIIKDASFLLGNRYYADKEAQQYKTDKQPVKAIVIACNTATAYGKTDIEKFIKTAGLDIKVIGVIGAGVRGALAHFQKDENTTVGIMATAGTVASNGYVNELDMQKGRLGFSGNLTPVQQAGIGLAGAIDGSSEYISLGANAPQKGYKGPSETNPTAKIDLSILKRYGFSWENGAMLFTGTAEHPADLQINSVQNYIAYHVTSLMEQVRRSGNGSPLKAVIMGCTHYPFFTDVFTENFERLYNYRENGEYLYRECMTANVILIDPAENTAKELYAHLQQKGMFNKSSLDKSEFYISMPNKTLPGVELDPNGNFTFEYKYGRKAGMAAEYVKRVPFSRKSLTEETITRLKEKTPLIYGLMKNFNQQNPKTAELDNSEKLN